ncbi:hypothetical protein [Pseudonocardia spinosispora]|uniref:hypothetical protein n=1 Tax=Pseudonocardia spinosispora TaxID=103441 RepID=UPI0012EB2117|nr:hypothetical protein [Pseudonocardia spinosispora]
MTTVLARMPDLRVRVEAEHVQGLGGSCVGCGEDVAWPCDLYWIATAAHRLDESMLPTPRVSTD